jgi:hypothetical protein
VRLMSASLAKAPRRRSDLLVRAVEGETVILDRARGLIHRLNGSASLIWDRCNGEREVADIAASVQAAFHVNLKSAEQGVRTAIQRLAQLGLLDDADERAGHSSS